MFRMKHKRFDIPEQQLEEALDKLAAQGWHLIAFVAGQGQTAQMKGGKLQLIGQPQVVFICIMGTPIPVDQAEQQAAPEEPAKEEQGGAILLKAA